MLDIRKKIVDLLIDAINADNDLQNALSEIGVIEDVIKESIEHPANIEHGDFACNIALKLSAKLGKAPMQIAQTIADNLPTIDEVGSIEVANPGFINFNLSDAFFNNSVKDILLMKDKWGGVDILQNKSILLEHSSPNLFKPFHIGHLVNNTYGESIGRILEFSGASVTQVSFPSDVSPGIAKAVWGLIDLGKQDNFDIKDIGEAYSYGYNAYEESKSVREEVDKINKDIYNGVGDPLVIQTYKTGRELSLQYFINMTARLGSDFDDLILESEAEKVGKELVKENIGRVFYESDGAIIFRGSEHGLFDNVFINSAGFGTYLAKDLGLLKIKFNKYNFDKSVTITDIEQKQHFELLAKASGLINKEWTGKSVFLHHGRLSLNTGKISSRDGGVPLAGDILDRLVKESLERMGSYKADKKVAEQLALSAVKYSIAKVGMGKNIVMDINQSLSFEGDSGPYLQYTYARGRSVIRKSADIDIANINHLATTNVHKLLYRFPLVIEQAAVLYEPHLIANYLNTLASAYNSWYAQNKIIDGTAEQSAKVALTGAVTHTIKNGLALLGINAPEQM